MCRMSDPFSPWAHSKTHSIKPLKAGHSLRGDKGQIRSSSKNDNLFQNHPGDKSRVSLVCSVLPHLISEPQQGLTKSGSCFLRLLRNACWFVPLPGHITVPFLPHCLSQSSYSPRAQQHMPRASNPDRMEQTIYFGHSAKLRVFIQKQILSLVSTLQL